MNCVNIYNNDDDTYIHDISNDVNNVNMYRNDDVNMYRNYIRYKNIKRKKYPKWSLKKMNPELYSETLE